MSVVASKYEEVKDTRYWGRSNPAILHTPATPNMRPNTNMMSGRISRRGTSEDAEPSWPRGSHAGCGMWHLFTLELAKLEGVPWLQPL